MQILDKIKQEKGVIAVMVLFGVSAVALAIVSSLVVLSIGENRMANYGGSLEQTFYMAESGLNEALYQLITDPVAGVSAVSYNGYSLDATVINDPADPYGRIIESTATSPTGKVRIVRVSAKTNSFGAGFDYAVQGGTGGIIYKNGSKIIGDAYSNGPALPWNPGQTGTVNGSIWVAGNNSLEKIDVSGNAYANTIKNADIDGDAYYQSISGSTVLGASYPGSPNPEYKEFPLDEADIQTWKDEIDAGGAVITPNPAVCPAGYETGSYYCVMADETLDNVKIDAGLYVKGGVALTLESNIWVTGDVMLDNNGSGGKVKIDPSLEGGSVVIITDGEANVDNNFDIEGSGDPRSFVLLVSLSTSMDDTNPAIQANNNSSSIVFAALKGMLLVKNNGFLNAACAEKLLLENNSTVTYNPLLNAFTIPSANGDNIRTELGSWEEL